MADPNLGEVAASVWEQKIGTKPDDNIFESHVRFGHRRQNARQAPGEHTLAGPRWPDHQEIIGSLTHAIGNVRVLIT